MKWPQKKYPFSRKERIQALKKAFYNVFYLPSEAVYLDLLTDSGTGRMSEKQWKALRNGDESYAGSRGARKLKSSIKNLFGMPYVLLVHQGRAAENVFGNVIQKEKGMLVLGNTPFDTTRLHIESRGGIIVDCTDQMPLEPLVIFSRRPLFAGNLNTVKLEKELVAAKSQGKKIAYILITATCNSNAGQPVSLSNIRLACKIARKYKIPVFLDLARYAENAFFIKSREKEFSHLPVKKIVREMAKEADGFLASGKKDALGNIGGFMGLRSPELTDKLIGEIIKCEGLDLEYTSGKGNYGQIGGYGGMSGRDMEALNQGIQESTNEKYLASRLAQVERLAKALFDIGIPVLPPGGHAVFVDAGSFLPHIPWNQFPGHALVLALYSEGGIRAVEVGSLMLGRDPFSGKNRRASQELTRLAIPRRLYSDRALKHVVETFKIVKLKASKIMGIKIKNELVPRHFRGAFEWK